VAATLEISPPSSGGKTEEALTEQEKKELLRLAREAITLFLQNKNPPHYTPSSPRLLEKKGVFVTLHHNGRLRGCIGFIESSLPLYQTVIQAAIYAAVKDVRFNPVSLDELPDVEIEISVLTPLTTRLSDRKRKAKRPSAASGGVGKWLGSSYFSKTSLLKSWSSP